MAMNATNVALWQNSMELLRFDNLTKRYGEENVCWDETEGPPVRWVRPGFGTRLLKSALTPFDGKTEVAYQKSGVHCTIQCRIPLS